MRIIAAVTCVVIIARPLAAEEPQPNELTIRARAIEMPALKYRLLPAEAELKPGDAAPILLRLPWERTQWMQDVFPTLQQWESRPLDAPEWAASNGVLPDSFVREMKRAAFRRDAHWEYPIGEEAWFSIALPDVQGLRHFLAYGLAARIRYHLSRHELDLAREGILIGLANGRHLARTPFYVNQLAALAIHRSMLERTAELVSQPGGPNLYWALSALPESLIELDRAASLEGDGFATTFPALSDLDRPREAKEWRKMAEQLIQLLVEMDKFPQAQQQTDGELRTKTLFRWTKFARAELVEMLDIPPENVAAMSDEEASIRWYVGRRIAIDQQTAAIVSLPPRDVWPAFRFRKLRKEIRALHEKAGTHDPGFFDPGAIYLNAWSLKRQIQSLRIIEAVRDYLAAHEGKLPASLDEIQDVPIPLDPLTDQPFEWRVEGDSAVLKAPPLPADAIVPDSPITRFNSLEYRLQVK